MWTFVDLAKERLARDVGVDDVGATELLLTLNRASGIVTYDLEATVHRPRGRSWAAFRVLYVLWLAGPLEAKKVAELAGLSRAALSNLLGGLVRSGTVAREADPSDGRVARLSLTQVGTDEITETFQAHHEREVAWATALDDDERATLVRLLGKLVAGRSDFDVTHRP